MSPATRVEFGRRRALGYLASLVVGAAAAPLGGCVRETEETPKPDSRDDLDAVLASLAQTLAPARTIPSDVYEQAAQALLLKLDDPAIGPLLVAGLKELAATGAFPDGSLAERTAILERIEATPFFVVTRYHALTGIFGNPVVWPVCGYEGSSFEHGGYVDRGFNDLDWLPPIDDSADER